ncbi:hypothetical protein BDV12DRAFT_171244 [Aspergillus spectabilis]
MLCALIFASDMASVAALPLTTDRLQNQTVNLCGPTVLSMREQVGAINRLRKREGKTQFIELEEVSEEKWPGRVAGVILDGVAREFMGWWGRCDGLVEMEVEEGGRSGLRELRLRG